MIVLDAALKQFLLETWLETNSYAETNRRFWDKYSEKRHDSTIAKWVKQAVLESALYEEFGEEGVLEYDRTITQTKLERQYYKRQYTKSLTSDIKKNRLEEVIKEHAQALAPVPVKEYKNPTTNTSDITAVAPLTDIHIGEIVDIDQMGGLNEYNMDIFNKRLFGWATQVLSLIDLRRTYTRVPRLVVPMLGDMVSGEIHDELTISNEDSIMGQVSRGAFMVAQSLMMLAGHVDDLFVPCVVGNHGRLQKGITYKNKWNDWDYMFYQWVAAFCKDQPNIRFSIPKTFYQVIDVENKKILIHHGDQPRFGGGGQTKVASIRQLLQIQGVTFDAMMYGHFHHVDEWDIGTGPAIMCGCMKGTDEYAMNNGLGGHATHVLTFWHPKHGYISRDVIYLQRFDAEDGKFDDLDKEVWANAS